MIFDTATDRLDVALVTGPSGAGRTTAIHALEDTGFETIDRLPLYLVDRLFASGAHTRPLAIGIAPESRDFSAEGLLAILERLDGDPRLEASLVFIDCTTDTLLRRYSETRRRHPLARDETPLAGIERERKMLAPLIARADIKVDTSEMSPHDLKAEITRWFSRAAAAELAISVQSFSYKRGTPRSADMVYDCRFLRNPHWEQELKPFDGRDPKVGAFVEGDPLCTPFLERVVDMLTLLLPAMKAEGKAYLTIAFGCTGGKHRSVYVAEKAAKELAEAGWRVSIRHRELEHAPGEAALSGVVTT